LKNVLILKNGRNLKVSTPITSNIFRQLIIQQNATLLSNGMQITDTDGNDIKSNFGMGFDRALSQLGEHSLKHGVSYGYWDYDHIRIFTALEFFTLDDERSGVPMAGVRFWNKKDVTLVEFYEADGVTEIKITEEKHGKNKAAVTKAKTPYGITVRPMTNTVEAVKKYSRLPIVPFYGNSERTSELTRPIKAKIDFLDNIWTNFGDSASRINIIYWILKNYSVTPEEAFEMIEVITKLGIAAAQDDKFTAEAKAFEIPSESVEKAIEIVERAISNDFGGVYIKDVTGGSLTNVALNIAFDNLMKKIARYEWQPFYFVQDIMSVIGLPPTENISFKYEIPRNIKEYSDMVINAANYLDEETILIKLPFIAVDEVKPILKRLGVQAVKESDKAFPVRDGGGSG
jgi:hypothetical protein